MRLCGSYVRAKVDDLGRIVIPIDIRKNLNIKPKDRLRIYFDEETQSFTVIKKELTDLDKSIQDIKEAAEASNKLDYIDYIKLTELLMRLEAGK